MQEVKPEQVKADETFTVKEIWAELGGKTGKISLSQVYKLIEREILAPAYRFNGTRGTCVPKQAVFAYKESCQLDMGR